VVIANFDIVERYLHRAATHVDNQKSAQKEQGECTNSCIR
jgi:hypothetical protein